MPRDAGLTVERPVPHGPSSKLAQAGRVVTGAAGRAQAIQVPRILHPLCDVAVEIEDTLGTPAATV